MWGQSYAVFTKFPLIMTVAIMMNDHDIYFYDDIDNSNNDGDDRDDDGGNVGEWVVLTVPLSRQLQFLMQAGRCQVMMLLLVMMMMPGAWCQVMMMLFKMVMTML